MIGRENLMNEYPSIEQVKYIFNEVHNVWFKKYREAKTDEDFKNLIRDAHSIIEKYPFNLTEVMLLELIKAIECYVKEGC